MKKSELKLLDEFKPFFVEYGIEDHIQKPRKYRKYTDGTD